MNALAAIAVATHCGASDEAICRALEKFQGTGRRFQIYGELDTGQGQVMLIDDYGHHPREIAATLEAHAKRGRHVVFGIGIPASSLHTNPRYFSRFR